MRAHASLVVIVSVMSLVPVRAARAELPPPEVRAWQVGLLRPDRLQHASLSATLALGIGLATRRAGAGLAGALTLGLAKEVWDRHRSGFDIVDLTADALGAAAGAAGAEALGH